MFRQLLACYIVLNCFIIYRTILLHYVKQSFGECSNIYRRRTSRQQYVGKRFQRQCYSVTTTFNLKKKKKKVDIIMECESLLSNKHCGRQWRRNYSLCLNFIFTRENLNQKKIKRLKVQLQLFGILNTFIMSYYNTVIRISTN